MACEHDGFREIVTQYDRAGGLLTYYWRCESCGLLLQEASRLRYRPRFAPLPQALFLSRPGIEARRYGPDAGPERRQGDTLRA